MQIEIALAKIQGKKITEFPKDLYIPPDAMLVVLDIFEGPLDLLLYLIRKNNLDILDIPVATITKQYIEYIEYMQFSNLDLAADYLEMAAILAEIKSRMLLPVMQNESMEGEEDPRAELIKKLQEYEQIKQAAISLDKINRQDRDYFIAKLPPLSDYNKDLQPAANFEDLLFALKKVLIKKDLNVAHKIIGDNLSIRDKMTHILTILKSLNDQIDPSLNALEEQKFISLDKSNFFLFSDLFNYKEGRLGIVVTFLAILELVKEEVLEILQTEYCAPIYIKLIK